MGSGAWHGWLLYVDENWSTSLYLCGSCIRTAAFNVSLVADEIHLLKRKKTIVFLPFCFSRFRH